MLGRKQISDLSQTGHPRETARLILDGIKEEKMKSKKHIDNYHSVSIHFIPKDGIVNIDVHEGSTIIPMVICKETAVSQAYKTQEEFELKNQAHKLLQA